MATLESALFHLLAVFLTAVLILTSGCGERPETVRIDGSSTVFPIARAAVEGFYNEYPASRVVASSSGTGAGFQRFMRGETDISTASRPIRQDELDRARENNIRFVELPIAYDGLAVIVHPTNTWVECLTVSELNRIWRRGSDITRWHQIRDDFPDREIRLYGRSPASGTFDYFTTAINEERGNVRDQYQASDTDNAIVQGISRDINGMAFFGLAYYENNRDQLKLVAIDDENPDTGDGCIYPTEQTVRDGSYQPLARPEFLYVNVDRMERNPEVAEFVRYTLRNAVRFVRQAEYVPFEDDVYARIADRFERRVEGSMFAGGGPTVGVHITDLLDRLDDRGDDDIVTESSSSEQ